MADSWLRSKKNEDYGEIDKEQRLLSGYRAMQWSDTGQKVIKTLEAHTHATDIIHCP